MSTENQQAFPTPLFFLSSMKAHRPASPSLWGSDGSDASEGPGSRGPAVMFSITTAIRAFPQPSFFWERGLWLWAHCCGCIDTPSEGPAWLRWIMTCYCDDHSFCNFTSIKRGRLKGCVPTHPPKAEALIPWAGSSGEDTWN